MDLTDPMRGLHSIAIVGAGRLGSALTPALEAAGYAVCGPLRRGEPPPAGTDAVLDGHNSPAAAETVRAFLSSQNDYPPRLRQVIEQTADPLMRAAARSRVN